MRKISAMVLTALLALLSAACATPPSVGAGAPQQNLTAGKVQREIRVGMSGAEVATALGSPNIVTTDEERREVWVYDKFATEARSSQSSAGLLSLIIFTGAPALLGVSGSGSQSSSSTSQRTLTVVIKFDDQKKVRDFAYHASSF